MVKQLDASNQLHVGVVIGGGLASGRPLLTKEVE